MKRLQTLILIMAVGTAAVASGSAAAHAKLTLAVPAAGTVLNATPKLISLTFNEAVEPAFSTITVSHADGAAVTTGAARVDPAAPSVLQLPLPILTAGVYLVRWATAGHDGHRRTGELSFTVQ